MNRMRRRVFTGTLRRRPKACWPRHAFRSSRWTFVNCRPDHPIRLSQPAVADRDVGSSRGHLCRRRSRLLECRRTRKSASTATFALSTRQLPEPESLRARTHRTLQWLRAHRVASPGAHVVSLSQPETPRLGYRPGRLRSLTTCLRRTPPLQRLGRCIREMAYRSIRG